MFALMVGRMAAYVGDQIMVQRLQTTRSLKDARQAFIERLGALDTGGLARIAAGLQARASEWIGEQTRTLAVGFS